MPESSAAKKGLWMVFLAAFLGWMFDGLEMGIFPIAARPAIRNMLKLSDDLDEVRGVYTPRFPRSWEKEKVIDPVAAERAFAEAEAFAADKTNPRDAIALRWYKVAREYPPSADPMFDFRDISSSNTVPSPPAPPLEIGGKALALARASQEKYAEGVVADWMGILIALFLMGAASGGLLFGWLGDRVGRVRAMTLSVLCYSLFTGAGYFAQDPLQLGILRFIAALGMGGEWSLGVALVMECWPEKYRPLMAGCIGAAANVGFALIALVTRHIHVTEKDWRWIMLAGTAPALLTFFIRLFVPESERWKESVKTAKASPLREIAGPALRGKTALAVVFASVALIGTWGAVQWIAPWIDKLTFNPLTGKGDAGAKSTAQLVSSLGAILGCLIGPLIGQVMGRRVAYFLLCLASLGACAWLFRSFDAYGPTMLFAIGVVGCVTASFYGWLPLYLPELFPTRVRATGQGLSFNFGRIMAAAGALYSGSLVNYYGGSYANMCATVTLVYLVGMAMIWLAPETKGKPLPE